MTKRFTQKQREAIEEKVEQLQKIIDGTLKSEELANMITERRLSWLKGNRNLLTEHLSLKDAYELCVYHHMKTEDGIAMSTNGNLLTVECRNFCPYLEASKILGLDTRFVCREIGEPSLRAFFQHISPRFYFSRDYSKIRPYSDFCLEFLEER